MVRWSPARTEKMEFNHLATQTVSSAQCSVLLLVLGRGRRGTSWPGLRVAPQRPLAVGFGTADVIRLLNCAAASANMVITIRRPPPDG